MFFPGIYGNQPGAVQPTVANGPIYQTADGQVSVSLVISSMSFHNILKLKIFVKKFPLQVNDEQHQGLLQRARLNLRKSY